MSWIAYDDMVKGSKPGYSAHLVQHDDDMIFTKRVTVLVEHIKGILADIEENSGKQIQVFEIGKTFAMERKSRAFSMTNAETWKVDKGICYEWRKKEKKEYNGLLVICALTGQISVLRHKRPHEDVACDLQQRLIEHFESDDRFASDDQQQTPENQITTDEKKASVLYMAFKLKERERSSATSTNEEDIDDHTDSDQTRSSATSTVEGASIRDSTQDLDRTRSVPRVSTVRSPSELQMGLEELQKEKLLLQIEKLRLEIKVLKQKCDKE